MRALLVILVVATCAGTAHATPYWTAEDAASARAAWESAGHERQPLPPVLRDTGSDYLADFLSAAWFIASMQVADSLSPDFGGIREGEHLPNVIQTDNTSESIWVFTRYWELTGDAAILPHLAASWTYVLNHPAHDEEGGSLPAYGYYRYYNCGWAVRAGMKYQQVFGDLSHKAYVDSCANYLAGNTLNLNGPEFDRNVNPLVLAWGGGNLHAYGVAETNSYWIDRSAARGNRVKGWVEADPAILGTEEWAMSGGAAMWGMLESYFAENPGEEAAWVATYAPSMDTFADPGAWENAWQGWYALAEKRLEQSTGDPAWGQAHLMLTNYLRAFDDTDDDGGIMANPADLDTQDQAWVTAYLAFMGLEPLLLEAVPAPIAGLAGAEAGTSLLPSRPNPFRFSTTIPFRLRHDGRAVLEVIDTAGRRVALLADGVLPAGEHAAAWDGRDRGGRAVASGVYFYRLRAGGRTAGRLVHLR